jgi:hypothetical protein
MSLMEKLGIKEAELLNFPMENASERVPVLFVSFDGIKPTMPFIENILEYLKSEYTGHKFSDIDKRIFDPRPENPMINYTIDTSPQIFKVQFDCKPLDIYLKVWFINPGTHGAVEKVDCRSVINNYIDRLNQS